MVETPTLVAGRWSLEALLATAVEAADIAGYEMRHGDPHAAPVVMKDPKDFATALDIAIEQRLRAFLDERAPGIGFLGEELGGVEDTTETFWCLDPIDGTMNFAAGLPLCGVSLALIHRGRPVVGVVDLPFLRERYTAHSGGGAFCNGVRLSAGDVLHLSDAVVAVNDFAHGEGADEQNRERRALLLGLADRALRIRLLGSAAVAFSWVASGRLGSTVFSSNIPWDVSAAIVVIREAGGRVVDIDGSDHAISSQMTIAAAPAILDEVLGVVRESLSFSRS